ncbi:MAG: CBS domain-containing protein [Pseudomonadota bacterium]
MSCTVARFVRESLVILDEKISVAEGARLMEERNMGSIVVTSAGEVVGIITEQDMVRRVVNHGLNPVEVPIGQVCTRQLVSVSSDTSCRRAILKMHANNCRRLLVYQGLRFQGLVKLRDLANGIAMREKRQNWVPNLIVGLTLILVLVVIVMLFYQLPDMLNIYHQSGYSPGTR